MRLGILCGGGPAPGDELGYLCGHDRGPELRVGRSWDHGRLPAPHRGAGRGSPATVHYGRVEDPRSGWSVIRTSRANPTVRDEGAADPDWRLRACLESLRKLGIDALVTIGGDDTAFSASRLAEAARGDLSVAHVPKTIDNDLPLPRGIPTFGFETARSVGGRAGQ